MTKQTKSLRTAFFTRGIVRGGILMLTSADALALVDEAEKRGVGILGIDAFYITDKSTTPTMEFSIVLTDNNGAVRCSHLLAKQHLARVRHENLWFEVVTEED